MANVEREDTGIYQEAIRLNKFLALAGIGSRRKNNELILTGAVKVNGKIVHELGVRVNPSKDRVAVNGQTVHIEPKQLYILFNKPKDCITTLDDERGRTTIMDYVHVRERVFPVGRLDRNTTGVLLLTNDGGLANALMHPSREVEKIYRVRLDRGINDEHLTSLRTGIRLHDGLARVRDVRVIPGSRRKEILLSLHEGRNKEVRRMFEALRYDVKQLERVSYAGLTIAGLARGKWRHLTYNEIELLRLLSGLAGARASSKGLIDARHSEAHI